MAFANRRWAVAAIIVDGPGDHLAQPVGCRELCHPCWPAATERDCWSPRGPGHRVQTLGQRCLFLEGARW